jgi:TolB protein
MRVAMRKAIRFCILLMTILPFTAFALLSMELTRGVAGAIPIVVAPFNTQGTEPDTISTIIRTDLQNSGRFNVINRGASLADKTGEARQLTFEPFPQLGADHLVVGQVRQLDAGRYQVNFQLVDLLKGRGETNIVLERGYQVTKDKMRKLAHHISDLIYEQLTGTRGIFSTKIAYVVVQRGANRPTRYILEVSDQDGYDARPLLVSSEPIMSPSWSPNGRLIAYVSFEKKEAGIYIHDVATGSRRLLSEFPGINGAPAWSPDGRQLALVLSKGGSPNIYTQDINGGALKQITNDFYINTEPAWAPDGQSLLFTSNRSGGPQIFQADLSSRKISRLSFNGDYNARASYAPDGKTVTMIHRVSGVYHIALLDLDTGRLRVLNQSMGDSSSPSMAPNGSMILYDTVENGHNVLAMVSSDGSVQLRLPARNGEAQDPAWSPYLG